MAVIVHNKGAKLKLRHGVELMPGMNTVDSGLWQKCSGDEITKALLSDKRIQVVSGSAQAEENAEKPSEPPKPVAEVKPSEPDTPKPSVHDEDTAPDPRNMPAKELCTLVKASTDQEYLLTLLKTEDRPTVVKAINERLDALKEADFSDD